MIEFWNVKVRKAEYLEETRVDRSDAVTTERASKTRYVEPKALKPVSKDSQIIKNRWNLMVECCSSMMVKGVLGMGTVEEIFLGNNFMAVEESAVGRSSMENHLIITPTAKRHHFQDPVPLLNL